MPKNTRIYFVRHGEVENPDKIYYGRLPNFHLSEKGRAQARKTGKYLRQHLISAIYSSPLERCQDTSQQILKEIGEAPIFYSDKLMEVKTGYEGQPLADMVANSFDFFSPGRKKRGGESIAQVFDRSWNFITEVLEKHRGENVAVVTHGDIVAFLRAKLLWNTLELKHSRGPHYPKPASILCVCFDSNRRLIESSEINLM